MNNTIRVIVVDDNEVITSSVKKYFSKNEKIEIKGKFNNGKEALEYLVDNSDDYDLILMDLILPEYDGLKMLEELKQKNIKKQIIVLSSFKDDFTIRKAQALGANYYMLKPIDLKIIENRIYDLMNQKDEVKLAQLGQIEMEVSTMLHDLGIPSHVRGYKYIRTGVLLLYSNERIVTLVTKELYPQIANRFDTTPSRVERAIRHAIEISWSRGDIKLMEDLFGNSVDFDRSRPTNAEFLTTIADRIKIISNEVIA